MAKYKYKCPRCGSIKSTDIDPQYVKEMKCQGNYPKKMQHPRPVAMELMK